MSKGQIMTLGEHKQVDKVIEKAKKRPVADSVRIQVYANPELHKAFKMACLSEDTNMTDVITDLITDWLKVKGINVE